MSLDLSHGRLVELQHFLLKEELGSGMSRVVYVLPFDETKVIKVENSAGMFQNVKEWEFWLTQKWNTKVSKWLAPCRHISDCGTFLIMDRTEALPKARVPVKLPRFLTDKKKENFGLLNNKVVCHDYGSVILDAHIGLKKW